MGIRALTILRLSVGWAVGRVVGRGGGALAIRWAIAERMDGKAGERAGERVDGRASDRAGVRVSGRSAWTF